MAKNFSQPPPKEKNAQKPDSDELSWLILRNGTQHAVGVVRLLVTQDDLEQIVPALERLWRQSNNPHFNFKVSTEKTEGRESET